MAPDLFGWDQYDVAPAEPAQPAKRRKVHGAAIATTTPTTTPTGGRSEELPTLTPPSAEFFDWSVFDAEALQLEEVKPGPPKLRRDKNERKEYRIQRRNDLLVEAGWQLPANPTAGTTPDANAEGDAAAGAEGPTGEEAAGTGAEDPNSRRARLKRKTADKLAGELERNGKPTATGKAAAIARKFQHVPSIVTDGTGRHQRTVFVGNIPPELSKPGIVRALFTDCGVLLEVRPIRRDGRDFTGPKMCYCEFDSVASAQKATEKNGMTLGRNPLRINMAHDKNERLKAVQKKCHLKPQDAEKVNCRLLYASQRRLRLDAIEAGKSGRMKDILKELQPSNPPPPLVHPSRRPDAPVAAAHTVPSLAPPS